MNRLVTRDVRKVVPGRVAYSVWCDDNGHVIEDGTVFRFSPKAFRLCCAERQIDWLMDSAIGYDVAISDVTEDIAGLAVQGPISCTILKKMGFAGIEALKPFQLQHFSLDGCELMVSRTGFTGDLGYELWITPSLALTLWDELYAAGADHGIQPYGEEATNMARLEAGFIMPDMELHEALKTIHFEHDQSPFELNLGWLVDFDKPHFNGRSALLKEKARGPKYTLTRLDIPGNKPAEGAILYNNERCAKDIGYVTSAMWSPAAKANIALAMIKTEFLKGDIWAEIYHQKELRQYRKVVLCTVIRKPFWTPARARATPPPDY
jgi:aminomethyltransferase